MKFESTQDILNKLMSSSSLSQTQQRELQTIVDPKQTTKKSYQAQLRSAQYDVAPVYSRDYNYNPSIFGNRSYYSRKKTLNEMIRQDPNLYEMDKPIPQRTLNRDVLKEDLALAMEFSGKKNIPQRILDARNKKRLIDKNGDEWDGLQKGTKSKAYNHGGNFNIENRKSLLDIRFDECLQEIEERMSWLNEMRQLGNASQYEHIVKAQCSELLLEMKKINKERAEHEIKTNHLIET